jgi:hypothetical protein
MTYVRSHIELYILLYFTSLLEHNFFILGLMIIFLALKLVPSYYIINIQFCWWRFCSLRLVIRTFTRIFLFTRGLHPTWTFPSQYFNYRRYLPLIFSNLNSWYVLKSLTMKYTTFKTFRGQCNANFRPALGITQLPTHWYRMNLVSA